MPNPPSEYTTRPAFDEWQRNAADTNHPKVVATALCYADDLATHSILTTRQAQALILVGSDILSLEEAATVLSIGNSTLSEHLSTATEKVFEARFLTQAVFDLNPPVSGLEHTSVQYPNAGGHQKHALKQWQNYCLPRSSTDWRSLTDDTPTWGRYQVYFEPLSKEQYTLKRERYQLEDDGSISSSGTITQYSDAHSLITDAYTEGDFDTLEECVSLWKALTTSDLGEPNAPADVPALESVWGGAITLRDAHKLIRDGYLTNELAARQLASSVDASADVMELEVDTDRASISDTVINAP